jgi:beta-glucosidase-like glycosyl hydrolase
MGCHSGPVFTDDAAYRAIERDARQVGSELALTGADIAVGVERIDRQADRVISELESLETAIGGSGLESSEKEPLLLHVAAAQKETAALRGEVTVLRKDAGRLNDQLAEERKISAALSEEHDRREAAGAAVKAELEGKKEELAKVKGQRNLYLAILIAVCLGVLCYIAFRVLRFLRIIPV